MMMEKEGGDSFGLLTRGRDRNWGEMRREGMVNLGQQNDKALISPNKQVGHSDNSSKPSFDPSSSNKQTPRPKPGPHGLNSSRQIFLKPKAQEGRCTHCGGNKHTKDTCFQLYGYPEWWYELKGKKDEWNDHVTFITHT